MGQTRLEWEQFLHRQPLTPSQATECIRQMARHDRLSLAYSGHAKARLAEREILTGDLLVLLRQGFVSCDAEPTANQNVFKYCIDSRTPNSGNRSVRAVVIPYRQNATPGLRIITVMWVDEAAQGG